MAAPVSALANSVAAPRLPEPNHTRITPSASVLTLNSRTVPMSVSVSIATSAAPAEMAGRAVGNDTRKNTPHSPMPRLRAADKVSAPRSANAARANRYTYGYSDTTSTAAHNHSERTPLAPTTLDKVSSHTKPPT